MTFMLFSYLTKTLGGLVNWMENPLLPLELHSMMKILPLLDFIMSSLNTEATAMEFRYGIKLLNKSQRPTSDSNAEPVRLKTITFPAALKPIIKPTFIWPEEKESHMAHNF